MRIGMPLRTCSSTREWAGSSSRAPANSTPVHRPRVQHRHRPAAEGQPFVAEAEAAVVGVEAGEQVLLHPLLLQAQGHHRIGAGQGLLQAAAEAHGPPLRHRIVRLTRRRRLHETGEDLRHQGGRTAQHQRDEHDLPHRRRNGRLKLFVRVGVGIGPQPAALE